MKIIIKPILIILLLVPKINSFSQACNRFPLVYGVEMPECNNNPYTLIFEDNFDGNTLDLSTWEIQPWGQGELNFDCDNGDLAQTQELNRYENAVVSNGTLKIIADNQPVWGLQDKNLDPNLWMCDGVQNNRLWNYTSSNIWTFKPDFHYGKYEIRCRISPVKGLWPAFWTYSGDVLAGAPSWSENDFFEIYHDGAAFKYTNNILYDLNSDGNVTSEDCKFSMYTFSNNFSQWHTFTVYFENDRIEYFIDGNFINRKTRYTVAISGGDPLFCDDGNIAPGAAWDLYGWPRQPGRLILAMAIERGDNAPDNPSAFPATFEIDYVRYWERTPAPIPCSNNVIEWTPFHGYRTGSDALLFAGAKVEANNFAIVEVQNQIHIYPNFHAEAGSYFHAKIDPFACGSTAKLADSIPQNGEFSHEIKDTTEVINSGLQSAKQVEIGNTNGNQFIQVFPNPNNGQFNVLLPTISETVKLELTDLLGNVMMTEHTTKNNYIFDLSGYPKGMYLLKITIDSTVNVQKIIYQ